MGRPYAELLKIAEDVESSSEKVDVSTIDLSKLQQAAKGFKPEFKYLLNIAMSMDLGHDVVQHPQPQGQEQGPRTKRAAKAKPAAKTPTSLVEQTAVVESPKQTEGIKDEIGEFASRLSERSQPVVRLMNTLNMRLESADDTLLPKLSTPDQVTELERIIDGLGSNAFDKAGLEIVRKELYSLKKSISAERKRKGPKRESNASIDQSMVVLRDEHLEKALAILSDTLGGIK